MDRPSTAAEPPLVSVIMAVYNTEAYVGKAIESVMAQTYAHWELIVVDDGSTDASVEEIRRNLNSRITLVLQERNQGVAHALNRAMALAKGKYIARHDADDVSLPERFAAQVAFMETHPEVGILGGHAVQVCAKGTPLRPMDHPPTDNVSIQYGLLFDSPFVSSTVMFRRKVLEQVEGFAPERGVWDDYDMWSRIARHTCAANLPVPLLEYRMLSSGLTGTTRNAPEMVREQRRRNLRHYVPDADERSVDLIAWLGFRHSKATIAELRRAYGVLRGAVNRIAPDRSGHRMLLADARHRLMGLHVLDRSNILMAVCDRLLKSVVIAMASYSRS